MNLWNEKKLEPPASSSCKLQNCEINLHEVNGIMNDALNLFSGQIFLEAESKLLHSIIKLNKLKFRSTIGYKQLQKLNRCMRNYQEFNYKSLISWFIGFLPQKYEADTYFPSRNILDYFLVRTQGFGKLIVRVFACAEQVYNHWMNRAHIGHGLGLSIIIVAVQARLFIIFRYLLQCISYLYEKLLELRDKVPNIKYNWLPAQYSLPKALIPWLDAEWVFVKHAIELRGRYSDLYSVNIFEDEDDNDDVQFCQEYQIIQDDEDLQIVNEYFTVMDSDEEDARAVKVKEIDEDLQVVTRQVRSALGMSKVRKEPVVIINLDDDIGEPVERRTKIKEVQLKLGGLRTLVDLERFIQDGSHNYFRSEGIVKYDRLLSLVQVYKANWSSLGGGRKEEKRIVREVKHRITTFVETGDV